MSAADQVRLPAEARLLDDAAQTARYLRRLSDEINRTEVTLHWRQDRQFLAVLAAEVDQLAAPRSTPALPAEAPSDDAITGEFLGRMYHEAKAASLGPTKDDAVRDAWNFVADVVNHRLSRRGPAASGAPSKITGEDVGETPDMEWTRRDLAEASPCASCEALREEIANSAEHQRSELAALAQLKVERERLLAKALGALGVIQQGETEVHLTVEEIEEGIDTLAVRIPAGQTHGSEQDIEAMEMAEHEAQARRILSAAAPTLESGE